MGITESLARFEAALRAWGNHLRKVMRSGLSAGFHDVFLASIKKYGRVYEPEMAANFTLRSGGLRGLMKQAGMGMAMFSKGKIRLVPARSPARGQVKDIFKKAGAK